MKTERLDRRDSDVGSTSPENILELKSETNRLTNNIHSTYQAVLSQEQNQRNSASTYYLVLDSDCLKSHVFVHYCSFINELFI